LKSRYHKAEGIIIKSIKFGEGHKILTAYTKEFGRIEVTAFGSQKPKSKLANKTQLFNYVRFLLYHSHTKENEPFAVKEIEVLNYFDKIKEDYSRYIAASCIVEPVVKLIGREQQDVGIFKLILKSFYVLDVIEERKIIYLLIMYLVKLLSSMGYRFNLDLCAVCNSYLEGEIYADSFRGFPLCGRCKTANSLKLSNGAAKFISWAQNEELFKSSKVTMELETLSNIKTALQKVYEFIFNKSLDGWKYFDNLETTANR